MKKPLSIAIMSSTRGTILPEIFSVKTPDLQFCLFLTDQEHCEARKKAQKEKIPDFFIDPKNKSRKQWGEEAAHLLQKHNINCILLVGFMRILSEDFVQKFPMKILNVHPSLLPKFAGGMNMDVHEAVLRAGEAESGATIHFVTAEVDGGPVLLQESLSLAPNETKESLQKKVQKLESELFPRAIIKFANEYAQ